MSIQCSLYCPVRLVLALVTCLMLASCDDSTHDRRSVDAADISDASEVINSSEGSNASTLNTNDDIADISQIVDRSPLDPDSAAGWPRARYATAGRIPASAQRQGDARLGRQALLEQAYVSCGLPERVYRQLLAERDVVGIDNRSPAAAGLPFDMNLVTDSNGVSVVTSNCLTCHGSTLFGELVVGLGNEFLDFTNDASLLVERAGVLVRGEEETAAWELYADRIAAISPYIRTHTVGVNPANNLTFALIAHRDPTTNAWSTDPLLPLPPTDPPPVSVPPWWRMQKKTAMFNLGEARGDHARIMMAASMLCTDTIEELQSIDAYAADIRTFIASLQPPQWPFELDRELAEKGRTLFEQTCSACHGTYGSQGEYPARLVPVETVGTDPVLLDFAHGAGAAYIDWFNQSYYGQLSTAAPGAGYMAPPLDGVWATAPFLHNGSVPTIRALLNSSIRPAYWQHVSRESNNTDNYNKEDLGWHFIGLESGKAGADKPIYVYDTDLPGYSNQGHLFGDTLTEQQRSAIIEYLKTL